MKTAGVKISVSDREFILQVLQTARAQISLEFTEEDRGRTTACDAPDTAGGAYPVKCGSQRLRQALLEAEAAFGKVRFELPDSIQRATGILLAWYAHPFLDGAYIQRYIDEMVGEMSSCSPVMSTDIDYWRQEGARLREENKLAARCLIDRLSQAAGKLPHNRQKT